MGFYGPNDPTNGVKALKEVMVLRIRLYSTRPTSPCYNNTPYKMRHKIHIHKNESKTKMNLNTVKWAQ